MESHFYLDLVKSYWWKKYELSNELVVIRRIGFVELK